jgi:hypothetical protein
VHTRRRPQGHLHVVCHLDAHTTLTFPFSAVILVVSCALLRPITVSTHRDGGDSELMNTKWVQSCNDRAYYPRTRRARPNDDLFACVCVFVFARTRP